ncbi:MAG TPA: DUF3459 domain-containing protein, partial [Polyangiales bacterium]
FVYSGQHSNYRRRRHGNSSLERPGQQFVVYQQNHDQIGNTAQGMRISELVGFEKSKLGAVVTLTAPNLPLLFMGEEFFARTPFAYFVDHSDPELSEAVRNGRANEHALFQVEGGFIDPIADETFARCKIDWRALAGERESQMLRLYRDLLALRAANACLGNCDKRLTRATWNEDEHWLVSERADERGEIALCVFNFGDHARRVTVPNVRGRFRLALSTSDARYGGIGAAGHARFADIDGRDADPIELGPTSAVIYLSAGDK